MENCEICFKISCKKCSWVANDKEVDAINKGLLISCPVCDWSPSSDRIGIIK